MTIKGLHYNLTVNSLIKKVIAVDRS